MTRLDKLFSNKNTKDIKEEKEDNIDIDLLKSDFSLFNAFMFYRTNHKPPSELQVEYCKDLQRGS